MGRIKSMLVKRTSKQLLRESMPFQEGFDHNKKMLGRGIMPSKKIRNKIAGYLARLVKMERIRASQVVKKVPMVEETE